MRPCKACGEDASGLYCEACRVPKVASGVGQPSTVGTRERAASFDVASERVRGSDSTGTPRPRPAFTGATKVRKRKQPPRTEGLDSLTLTLYGAPRTKKTHNRLVIHEGRRKVLPSEQWAAWRDALAASGQVKDWMRLKDQDYNCAALFYRDRDSGDAVGFYQGLADVLEFLGVVSNDKHLVSWDGSRLRVDKARPRVEVTLTALEVDA